MARKFNVERALMLYQQHEIMRIRQGDFYSLRILHSFLTLPTVDFYFYLHSLVFDIKSFSLFLFLPFLQKVPFPIQFYFHFIFFHYLFYICLWISFSLMNTSFLNHLFNHFNRKWDIKTNVLLPFLLMYFDSKKRTKNINYFKIWKIDDISLREEITVFAFSSLNNTI